MTKLTPQDRLASLKDSYDHKWGDWEDGSPITPDSLVSGAANQDATVDDDGSVWLESSQCWASDDQIQRIVEVLQEHGNVSRDPGDPPEMRS